LGAGQVRIRINQASELDAEERVDKPKWSAFIEGKSSSDTVPKIRDQGVFAEKYAAKIENAMNGIEVFIQKANPGAELITVYPKTGKAIWRDAAGVHTYNFLTKDKKGVPSAIQALRAVYKESGDWKTELWPTYDEHTKGNDNGSAALFKATPRLKERYNFSEKNKIHALAQAKTPAEKMTILKNLYVMDRFKSHMVNFFEAESEKWSVKAKTQLDITIQEQENKIAENFRVKAAYFKGDLGSGEGVNWGAINSSIINPINCDQPIGSILSEIENLHKKVLGKIEGYRGDKPIADTESMFADMMPLGDRIGSVVSHILGRDRTDHELVAAEKAFAIDQAILGIVHKDLSKQRYLTEQCYKKLGVDISQIPKDPVESCLGTELSALLARPTADMMDDLNKQILGNKIAEDALCSGLFPELAEEVRESVRQFAVKMKELAPELRLCEPVGIDGIRGPGIKLPDFAGIEDAGIVAKRYIDAFEAHLIEKNEIGSSKLPLV
jgi:hypothetical protein